MIEYEIVSVLPLLLSVMFEVEVLRANPEAVGPNKFALVVVVSANIMT